MAEADLAMAENTDMLVDDIPSHFPALRSSVNGKPLAYLDTAASAQKPQQVIDAMTSVMQDHYANIHRGLYYNSQETTRLFELARGKVADFLDARAPENIVFTRSTTESINLVAHSWGRANLGEGDEVILSGMEHHANIVPWQLLRDEIGISLKIIPVLDDGTLDMHAFQDLLGPRTRLVSVVQISNALGTINPVKKISELAKKFNPEIQVLIDGSQAVVHDIVSVHDLGADFYVFTGHKLYGPTGIGVLYGRTELLEAMPPWQGGGDMIETVAFDQTTFKAPPQRFEAGTPAFVEAIGLGAAIDFITTVGREAILRHEAAVSQELHAVLDTVVGLRLYGPKSGRAGIFSFTLDSVHPSDMSMILDQMGVAVRIGHHCCMPLMQRFGIDGTVRASVGMYTTSEDIKRFKAGLDKAIDMLG